MFLSKKGAQEGLGWIGYAILTVIAIFGFYFVFHLGLFGDVKEAFSKTFGTGEEYVELYEEHFEEEAVGSEDFRIAKLIKNLIENSFSKAKNENCIGYIDLSKIDEEISDYSVYFRRSGEESEFYVYKGSIKEYAEVLTDDALAFGKVGKELISRVLMGEEHNEFWLTDGLKVIYVSRESTESFTQDPITKIIIPKGGMIHFSLPPSKEYSEVTSNPHFLYKEGKFTLLARIPLHKVIEVNPNVYEQLCGN